MLEAEVLLEDPGQELEPGRALVEEPVAAAGLMLVPRAVRSFWIEYPKIQGKENPN
jgi:hypothetical protein